MSERWSWRHADSTVVPWRPSVRISGSPQSGFLPRGLVYTPTKPRYSQILSRKMSRLIIWHESMAVGLARGPPDLLDRRHVHLVVHVEAAHVLAVALQEVDELVDRAVLAEEHLRRVDAVLVEHLLHVLLGDVLQFARRRHHHAARRLPLVVHVGWPLVEPEPDGVELALEQLALALRLPRARVDDEEDEVGAARDADDLAAAPLPSEAPSMIPGRSSS